MTTHDDTLDARARGDALARTMPFLLGWFFAALWLGLAGAFVTTSGPPIAIGLAILLPLALFWVDGRRGHPIFAGLARLDAPTLAVLQTFRVLGVVFLVAWQRGQLPAGFALPAGLGDVAVGVMAPFVAAALARERPWARGLFVAWCWLGLADLVVAVSSGVAHSQTTLGFLARPGGLSTNAIASYPFSLIPTFFVPLAVMLHVLGLRAAARIRPRI